MDDTQKFLFAVILIVIFLLYHTTKKLKKKGKADNSYKGFVDTTGYAPPSPFCDNPVFAHPLKEHREANHQFRMLRMEYDTIIKRHNRMQERISRTAKAAREFKDYAGPETQEVIDLCLKDIQDAPKLMEYAKKWAAMQGSTIVFSPQYDSFRRLAIIYERQGKYVEAIDICNRAIELGIEDEGSSISLKERRKKLIEKAQQKSTQINAPLSTNEMLAEPPKRKISTTREELESFEVIRAVAAEIGASSRITYRDTLSYFSIQLDGNSRLWICRIKVESGPKWVTFHPLEGEKESGIRINSPGDLYQYHDKIISVIQALL